ncbi:CvpA family protein [soil metagenome]
MVLFDWIVVIVLVVSTLLGLMRGLVFEVMSLAGWIAAFIAAQWLATDVASWLPFGEVEAAWRYPLAFVLVFIAVAFGVGLVASLLRKLIAVVGLRPVDRLLGAGFGAVRGAVALLVLAIVMHLMSWTDAAWWQTSQSVVFLDAALQALKPALPEKLASYLP